MSRSLLLAVVLCPLPLCSQAPNVFEVASVRVHPPIGRDAPETIDVSGDRLTVRNISLLRSLQWAYDFKEYQVSGPDWMRTERYDIEAKAPGPASETQMRRMLQPLLTERFQMSLRRETKEDRVYELVVAKNGAKLEPSTPDAKYSMKAVDGELQFDGCTMDRLSTWLSSRPFGVDHPIVDKTGLAGAYRFGMKLADTNLELRQTVARQGIQDPSTYGPSLGKLGLRLEPQRGQIETLIVDRAEKVPTTN